MNAEEQLRRVLQATPAGRRVSVPVVGSGLNIQAARIEERTEDDWSGLLARVAEAIGTSRTLLETLPSSNLSRWESMLCAWARVKQIEPFQAESQLQKLA